MSQTLPQGTAQPWAGERPGPRRTFRPVPFKQESGWSAGIEGESQSAQSTPLPGIRGDHFKPQTSSLHMEKLFVLSMYGVAAKRRALEPGSGLGAG